MFRPGQNRVMARKNTVRTSIHEGSVGVLGCYEPSYSAAMSVSFTILVPNALAERCYLPEALLWLAVYRFPLAEILENGVDARESMERIDGCEPTDSYLDTLSDEECARVGLPPNPTFEEMVSGDVHLEPEMLRSILKIRRGADRAKLERDLEESITFHERRDAWDLECKSFLDRYKAKLFLALREGTLAASGKRLPKATYSESMEQFDDEGYGNWFLEPWVAIPSSFWISDAIDWGNSDAEGRGVAYSLILIRTRELLQCFPPPPSEPINDVVKVGGTLVRSNEAALQAIKRSFTGRPSLNWDQFGVEVARRVKAGNLPEKQEAFIAEMQLWCRERWNREVARSTLLQKIKPYYDEFVRVSKTPGRTSF